MRRLGQALDSLAAALSPAWALSRAEARSDLGLLHRVQSMGWGSGAYAGGQRSRLRQTQAGYRSREATEDSQSAWGLRQTQLECMDLYRNDPLCKSGVNGVVRYAGQSRPRANAQPTDPQSDASVREARAWNFAATDYFMNYWWPRADARRMGDFGTLQDMVLGQSWWWGDMVFVIRPDGLLPIDGMQIATPQKLQSDPAVVNGLRISGGRISHVYICGYGRYGQVDTANYDRVPINALLYCGWHWRAGQWRSVPKLHGVVDMLRDHDTTHNNVTRKIEYEACLLTKERAGALRTGAGRKTFTNSSTGVKSEVVATEWGRSLRTNGDPSDFELISGNTPNAQYVPTMEYHGRLVAAGMGVPYEFLMHLQGTANWSANKALRADVLTLLTGEHSWRNRVFNSRVWNLVISDAIRNGDLPPAPLDRRGFSQFHKAEWSMPQVAEMDPGKEEDARSKGWGNARVSLNDWARERNMTRDEMLDAHDEDVAELRRRAAAQEMTVSEYVPGLVPKATPAATSAAASAEPEKPDADDED